MKRFIGYFLRGLVLLAPLAVTLYICWLVFVTVDSWLGLPVPGAGFAVTIVLVTVVGFMASTLLRRTLNRVVELIERAIGRLPFVRLLYTSTKDLLNAFVGEKRRFDQPVLLTLSESGSVSVLGFVTQSSLVGIGLEDRVAVYLPQSYNFAGNLLIVPATSIRAVPAESADVMAFIVSGGVTRL